MNDDARSKRDGILRDLLKEKSLWQVYCSSRSIRSSNLNALVGISAGIVVGVASYVWSTPPRIADQLGVLAGIAFSNAIGLLGFLLAGFAFFATVADKAMFCRMAQVTHDPSGLSYLKYNFFIFMRVFVEYLVFSLGSLAIFIGMSDGSGIRVALADLIRDQHWPAAMRAACSPSQLVASFAFGAFAFSFVYLLMQLKSFIFNVFHVVMTSIRWSLEDEFEREDQQRTESAPQGASAEKDQPHA